MLDFTTMRKCCECYFCNNRPDGQNKKHHIIMQNDNTDQNGDNKTRRWFRHAIPCVKVTVKTTWRLDFPIKKIGWSCLIIMVVVVVCVLSRVLLFCERSVKYYKTLYWGRSLKETQESRPSPQRNNQDIALLHSSDIIWCQSTRSLLLFLTLWSFLVAISCTSWLMTWGMKWVHTTLVTQYSPLQW